MRKNIFISVFGTCVIGLIAVVYTVNYTQELDLNYNKAMKAAYDNGYRTGKAESNQHTINPRVYRDERNQK